MLSMMFVRLYLPARLSFYVSDFMNPRTQRVCTIHGCKFSQFFALKSVVKEKPYPFFLTCLGISILTFAYLLRLFEAPISEASNQDFTSYNNAMWNMIITLTSAGYGDLYPKTFFGRIVGVLICFWGVLIVSFFVVTVTNMLNFTEYEEKAYYILMRLHHKHVLKIKAVNVLSAAYQYREIKRDHADDSKLILNAFRSFRKYLIEFRSQARVIRSIQAANGQGSGNDVMQTILENLMQNIEDIKNSKDETRTHLNDIIRILKRRPIHKQSEGSVS